jgi:hypothetical protein
VVNCNAVNHTQNTRIDGHFQALVLQDIRG